MTTTEIEATFRRAARAKTTVYLGLHTDGLMWDVTGHLGDAAHRSIPGAQIGRCLYVDFDDQRGEGHGAIYERVGGGHVVVYPVPGSSRAVVLPPVS